MGLELGVSLLIIISVVVVSLAAFSNRKLLDKLILIPQRVTGKGELYRLMSAGWVHGDMGHLVFNMLTFYFFGPSVERVLGTPLFLGLYLTAVPLAFVPTVLRHKDSARYRSLGASGGVAAIIFSAILARPEMSLYLMFIPIPIPGWLFAIGYLAYSAYSSRRGADNVNHDAHFAGAVYGLVFTAVTAPQLASEAVTRLLG